jgi:hypothetical protein
MLQIVDNLPLAVFDLLFTYSDFSPRPQCVSVPVPYCHFVPLYHHLHFYSQALPIGV